MAPLPSAAEESQIWAGGFALTPLGLKKIVSDRGICFLEPDEGSEGVPNDVFVHWGAAQQFKVSRGRALELDTTSDGTARRRNLKE